MGNEQLSHTHFVVRPEFGLDADAVRAAVGAAARVEPLESPRGGCVVTLAKPADPEATCASLRARLDHRAQVLPAVTSPAKPLVAGLC